MARQMTSRERVLAALRGDPVDRTPVFSPVSLANIECMRLSKAYFPQACLNSNKIAALAETSYTVLGYDSIMPHFGIATEAGALGCDVSWGGIEYPPMVYNSSKTPLADFTKPQNYLDSKQIRALINAMALLKTRYNDRVALVGKVLGPLSILFYMNGIQSTLNSLILEPELVAQVLDALKDLCIDFAHAQIEAGADIITISEDAAGDLISRECFRTLLMPVERELLVSIQNQAEVIFHLSSDVMDRADLFKEAGFKALSFDSRNDIVQLKKIVGDMKLIGGVNNPSTLLNGKKENIAHEVFFAMNNGVSLIGPECAIPLRVSNDSLIAIKEAVLQYEKLKPGIKSRLAYRASL